MDEKKYPIQRRDLRGGVVIVYVTKEQYDQHVKNTNRSAFNAVLFFLILGVVVVSMVIGFCSMISRGHDSGPDSQSFQHDINN